MDESETIQRWGKYPNEILNKENGNEQLKELTT